MVYLYKINAILIFLATSSNVNNYLISINELIFNLIIVICIIYVCIQVTFELDALVGNYQKCQINLLSMNLHP